jgi:quercetin dioxygenase-like cupin family protein
MRTLKWKLLFVGMLAACAVGGVTLGVAWATPPAGVTRTILAGPVLLGDVELGSESDFNEVEIQMKGSTDVYVVRYVITPGGDTGWHSHPGPCLVSVKSGTATEYRADDPLNPSTYAAGEGFAENPGHAHLVVNKGLTDLELIVIHIVPIGAPLRIDEPAP